MTALDKAIIKAYRKPAMQNDGGARTGRGIDSDIAPRSAAFKGASGTFAPAFRRCSGGPGHCRIACQRSTCHGRGGGGSRCIGPGDHRSFCQCERLAESCRHR